MSIPQTPAESAPLAAARAFLRAEVAPVAQAIDVDAAALGRVLRAMATRGLLGMRVPAVYGGAELDEREFRHFQEECARSSGVLAFLQTQHQSACSMIAKGENEDLKSEVLPRFSAGDELCGIAFSQLRRKEATPVLSAIPTPGGIVLNGAAPWVTGLGFFDWCVTAATLEGDTTIFVLHRLAQGQGLALSEPMRLASMEPAQTVSAEFSEFFVPNENVLGTKPGNWIENNDMINIALQSPFALGCARAALDIVEENSRRKNIPEIAAALSVLAEELDRCRTEAYAAMDERDDAQRNLNARGWAIEMALKCAAAAVVTSSGAGNSMKHPAQRVYREALVFSVSAQTGEIMAATLARLSRTSA